VVAGTDTNNLTLFLVGVNHNISANTYVLYVDKYNATTFVATGGIYSENKGTQKVYDISMATDYRFPAMGASPYSVAFAYSINNSNDSINYVASVDAGATWGVKENIATTDRFFRKVSLAYGQSYNYSNGRYFAAWEQYSTYGSRNAHIYTSRTTPYINSPWVTPVNLDSLDAGMINLCRNPSMAVQFDTTDNDSSAVTAVVLMDRDYNGAGVDYDLLGFYNKRATTSGSNHWHYLQVNNNTPENDMTADITYDPFYNNFLVTYYDSTDQKLPYVVNNVNLTMANPNSWTVITSQYNDNPNLTAPYPRVEINPVMNQAAHAWNANGTGTNGVAMFDAEYAIPISVQEVSQGIDHISVYPNPVTDNFNISMKAKSSDAIAINVLDLTGKIVFTQNASVNEGDNLINVNAGMLAAGIYVVNIHGTSVNTNIKIIVR